MKHKTEYMKSKSLLFKVLSGFYGEGFFMWKNGE